MTTDMTDDRLRTVPQARAWTYCWRCRQPYCYDDLHYSGIDAAGQWRFECRFCREEARHGRLSAVERIRARTIARQRLFDVLRLQTARDLPRPADG